MKNEYSIKISAKIPRMLGYKEVSNIEIYEAESAKEALELARADIRTIKSRLYLDSDIDDNDIDSTTIQIDDIKRIGGDDG